MSDTTWTYINKTLGLNVPVKVPFASTEDYDRLAGEVGAWKATLAAAHCYSGHNKLFGDALAEKLAVVTGVPIPTTGEKRKTRAGVEYDVTVSPKLYIDKLAAEKSITAAQLQEVATEVAESLPPLEIASSSGPAKPSKEFMNQALQLQAQLNQKSRTVEDWFTSVSSKFSLPAYDESEGYSQAFLARCLVEISRQSLPGM